MNTSLRFSIRSLMTVLTGAAAATLVACASTSPSLAMPPTPPTPVPSLNVPLTSAQIADLLASPNRSSADRETDAHRKPQQTLEFIGVWSGMVALDLSAGGGYTAELLARAAGLTGRVYGQNPPREPARPNPLAARAVALQSGHLISRLFVVTQPFESPVPAELTQSSLDLVTLMFNYHDLGHWGVDRARMNAAVFAALKSGGFYMIADDAGRPGTGISESGTLHRIEESFLRAEVERAGFRLNDEGNFLRNPNDPRDRNEPMPPQPKDAFILKFVKP